MKQFCIVLNILYERLIKEDGQPKTSCDFQGISGDFITAAEQDKS